MRFDCRLLFIPFVVLLSAPNESADHVILTNSDGISGEIIYISGNEMQVVTEYAGEIRINFTRVADLRSDGDGRLILENRDRKRGRLDQLSEDQRTAIRTIFNSSRRSNTSSEPFQKIIEVILSAVVTSAELEYSYSVSRMRVEVV